MTKIKAIFLLFFLQTIIVLSQNRTEQNRVSHKVYGAAIEEATYNKDSVLVVKKIFTLNKKFTKRKYEIGTAFYYYENGILKAKGNYYKPNKANLFGERAMFKEGEWTIYNEKGNVLSTTFLKDNRQHGIQKNYHINGNVASNGFYKKGNIEGATSHFFINQQLHRKVEYKNGKVFNIVAFYDLKGNKINHGTLKNGYGTLKIYDLETGDLKEVATYEDGIPENKNSFSKNSKRRRV